MSMRQSLVSSGLLPEAEVDLARRIMARYQAALRCCDGLVPPIPVESQRPPCSLQRSQCDAWQVTAEEGDASYSSSSVYERKSHVCASNLSVGSVGRMSESTDTNWTNSGTTRGTSGKIWPTSLSAEVVISTIWWTSLPGGGGAVRTPAYCMERTAAFAFAALEAAETTAARLARALAGVGMRMRRGD